MPQQILTGLTETLPENLTLNSGELIWGINLTMLRSGTSTSFADAVSTEWTDYLGRTIVPRTLGTTRGDTKFMAGMNIQQVKANGLRFPMVGLDMVREVKPTLSTALLEASDWQQLQMILAGTDMTPHGTSPVQYNELNQSLIIRPHHYLPNIAICATVAGRTQPYVIVLDNPLSDKDPSFDYKDNDEQAVGVTFGARGLLSQPTTIPCHFFVGQVLIPLGS